MGDRTNLLKEIIESPHRKIIVTHGTDTIIETAQYLQLHLQEHKKNFDKHIILTGSFLPEKFKDSDADFNLGMSIGAIEAFGTMHTFLQPESTTFESHSRVFIALNGLLIPA